MRLKMLSLISLPFISACSSTQLNVVDNLTVSSKNEGAFMSGKLVVGGHPLQTTFVSLNGQLALHAGQVCVSSRFRSPFNSVCLTEEELLKAELKKTETDLEKEKIEPAKVQSEAERKVAKAKVEWLEAKIALSKVAAVKQTGKIYTESYFTKDSETDLSTLINAANAEKAAASKRNIEKVLYLQCLQKKDDETLCDVSKLAAAENDLSTKRAEAQKALNTPNTLVYNWAESHKFDGGIVKGMTASAEKQASGYTVVRGVSLKRYLMNCGELEALKGLKSSKRLKIVTMTLSAQELYYNANEDSAFSAQLALAM